MAVSPAKHASVAFLLGTGAEATADIAQWLEPQGWCCIAIAAPEAIDAESLPAVAILGDGAPADAWIAAIRALPGLAAGTPVLALGAPDRAVASGARGRIDWPLYPAQAQAVLEQWAGPIAGHGFRDPDSPLYRLVRLAGREQAESMVRRFADTLEDALALAARGEPIRPVAHRVAGLAGLVGFGELTPLWSTLDRPESADPAPVVAATEAVLARIRRDFPKDEA